MSYDGNPVNHYAGINLSRELTLTQAARVVPRKVAEKASLAAVVFDGGQLRRRILAVIGPLRLVAVRDTPDR